MTPKQHEFIVKLVSERVLPETTQGTYVLNLVAGTAREPDARQSSAIIEWLLALPRKATPSGEPDVPAGRYALVHPERSIVEFFVVDRPQDGRWAGRTFVSQQASDEKYPVRGARRGEVLARIAEDPQAAMIRYGHELGRCGNCGRTLTDEVSRAMGIGPDCAAKLGIARISVEEAVTPTAPPAAAQEEASEPALPRDVEDVSRDKQGVPHAVGGWRARKRYAEQYRKEEKAAKPTLTQIEVLPGESWEDIFSA